MSVFLIILCIVSIILLILTEKVFVIIKQDDFFSIEVHFVFIALVFRRKNGKSGTSLHDGFYRMLIGRIKKLLKKSDLTVDYFTPKCSSGDVGLQSLFYPFGSYFLTCTLSVIASDYARRIKISEGCMESFFDKSDSFKFRISLQSRLYYIVYSLIPLLFKFFSTKKKNKRAKNV